MWNVTPVMRVYMYVGMAVALAVFAWGIWRRVRVWRAGLPEVRTDHWPLRLRRVLVDAVGQRVVVRERSAGLAHAALWAGFAVLFGATCIVMAQMDLALPIAHGRLYLYFVCLGGNIFGALALLGLAWLMVRRYLARPAGLERREPGDALLLTALFLLLVTGFLLSALRLAATSDPWAAWRPVALWLSQGLTAALPADSLPALHRATWFTHATLLYVVLAVSPFTKLLHVGTAPLAIYFGNLKAGPDLPAIAFEDPDAIEVLGVKSALDLTWKQLLDLDACLECGRCERACPANASGSPLSPKWVILTIRDSVRRSTPALLAARAAQRAGSAEREKLRDELPMLAGGVVEEDALWACTTCRACEAACPAGIEHVRLILQLRQNLAMEQAAMPDGIAQLPRQLELREH
ncbi:MAG TPA: (Fe-S)-binding protein, partial [Longimicrobiales bacterium]